MGRNSSNSLREMTRSLGVECGKYDQFRNALIKHLDKNSRSRNATIALSRKGIYRYLESLVDTTTAKRYARIIEDFDLVHSEAYNKAIPILRKLAYQWVRNLKKKKKPSRRAPVTTPANNSRSAMTDLEQDDDKIQVVQPELEPRPASAGRIETGGSTYPSGSTRDETVRPTISDVAIVTDMHEARPRSSQDQSGNSGFIPSDQLRFESNDLVRADPLEMTRMCDEIMSEEQISPDLGEQTEEVETEEDEDEDEEHHQESLSARAGERVRHDGVEAPLGRHSEAHTSTIALPNVPEGVQDRRSLSDQGPPVADESKLVLDLVLLMIYKRQRLIRESAKATDSNTTVERRDFALKTLDSLYSDFREIDAVISPRLT